MSDASAPQTDEPAPISEVDWAALGSVPAFQPQPARDPAPPQQAAANLSGAAPAQPFVSTAPAATPPGSPPRAPVAPREDFALFASLGQAYEAPPAPPPPAGSTLNRLRHVIAQSGESILPYPLAAQAAGLDPYRFGSPMGAAAAGAMPAAAVTVPLGEVMRLIAAGGLPAASPVDTFRAALQSSSLF